jgi:hypothetical protein
MVVGQKGMCFLNQMKDEYSKWSILKMPNNGSNHLCDIKLPNSPPFSYIGKKKSWRISTLFQRVWWTLI